MDRTVTSIVEPETSAEYTQIGTTIDVFANGVIHLASKTHDVSLVEEHIPSIKHLAADLEEAVKAVWPRRQDDDLGVLSEIQELKHVLGDLYNYNVETYDIPNTMPQRTLNQRIQQFLKYDEKNGHETLLIVYYAGHARRVYDSNEPPIWFANREITSPAAPCAGIQSLLEEIESDVLLLYDCCHSAPTRTNRCPQSRKSVTEAISACGYEAIAPEVDKHSFSTALIQTLAAASQGRPFSIGELHTWILGRLRCWLPSVAQNEDGNFIRHSDGRLAYERQPRKTPIYSILCETEPRRSIVLAPLQKSISDAGSLANSNHGVISSATSTGSENSLFGRRNPFQKPGSSTAGNDEYPQILLTVRLEKTELDIQVWRDWLRNLPAEGQDIKIDGIYQSFSTLLLLRMPVAIWDLLPENPAYSFAAFVTSENLISTPSQLPNHQEEDPKIFATDTGSSMDDEIPLSKEKAIGTPRLVIDSVTPSHDGKPLPPRSGDGTAQIWDAEAAPLQQAISTNEHKPMSLRTLKQEITELSAHDQHLRDRSPSSPETCQFRIHGMNLQISFIEGQFSLISIPLPLYSAVLQPILPVLLPHGGQALPDEPEGIFEGLLTGNQHGFLNITVTPIECFVVCHSLWAQNVFEPVIRRLPKDASKLVSISKETYTVFSISSAGVKVPQRVIDLTAALTIADIPVFSITTYNTDFILVPSKDHQTAFQTLLARGSNISEHDSAYVSRVRSSSEPAISEVAELQIRTFSQLKKKNVYPFVALDLRVVQCSGKELVHKDDYSKRPGSEGNRPGRHQATRWLENIDSELYMGLVSALAQQPRFLSVTLVQDDAPSLLIDKSLLWLFGNSLVGDVEGYLVPMFLNLFDLPLESSGIVCGFAGILSDAIRLLEPAASHHSAPSFLSTARTGAVILPSEDRDKVLDALQSLFGNDICCLKRPWYV